MKLTEEEKRETWQKTKKDKSICVSQLEGVSWASDDPYGCNLLELESRANWIREMEWEYGDE
jgi:hypothetical protein